MSRATEQHVLTVVVSIRAGMLESLRALLEEIGTNVRQNDHIRFQDHRTVHFCRYVLIPEDRDAPPSLVFSSAYDGDLEAHLDDLIAAGARGLDAIYGHCEGYPAGGTEAPRAVKAFLRAHAVDCEACYVSHPGLSVDSVRNDSRVREVIQGYLNNNQKTAGWPPSLTELRKGIQQALKQHPELQTAFFDRRLPTWRDALPFAVPAGLGTLAFLPSIAFLVGLWAVLLRYEEEKTGAQPPSRTTHINELIRKEDIFAQNQLSHLVWVKPGLLRLTTLKNVLFTVHMAARYFYNEGHLGGIPSIHFAHWVLLDGGKRLLFLSNYDGSWESYLSDFIGIVAYALTAIWSNTEGFPRARWLFGEGAADEQQFKQWARAHQIPTQVWYSAYPDVTVANITNNTAIRERVEGYLSESEIMKWLQRC